MLPIGGEAIWGNSTWAPDDTPELIEFNHTHGFVSAQYVNKCNVGLLLLWTLVPLIISPSLHGSVVQVK